MSRKAKKEKNIIYGTRLKALREEKGTTQTEVGRLIGVENSAISKYERGEIWDIPLPSTKILAAFFDVHPCYLIGLVDDRNWRPSPKDLTEPELTHIKKYRACDADGKKHVDYILNREYSRVCEPEAIYFKHSINYFEEYAAAGLGNYLTGSTPTKIEFPEKDIPPKTDYCLRIKGDSMEPEIPDGCIAFVRSCPVIENGQIGIFSLNGNAICKRLDINIVMKTVRLLSNNPAYLPIEITADDYLHTFGRVLGHVK